MLPFSLVLALLVFLPGVALASEQGPPVSSLHAIREENKQRRKEDAALGTFGYEVEKGLTKLTTACTVQPLVDKILSSVLFGDCPIASPIPNLSRKDQEALRQKLIDELDYSPAQADAILGGSAATMAGDEDDDDGAGYNWLAKQARGPLEEFLWRSLMKRFLTVDEQAKLVLKRDKSSTADVPELNEDPSEKDLPLYVSNWLLFYLVSKAANSTGNLHNFVSLLNQARGQWMVNPTHKSCGAGVGVGRDKWVKSSKIHPTPYVWDGTISSTRAVPHILLYSPCD